MRTNRNFFVPSLWESSSYYRQSDVIIVTSGFTGLWSAISIQEKYPEKSVLVVERNAVPNVMELLPEMLVLLALEV